MKFFAFSLSLFLGCNLLNAQSIMSMKKVIWQSSYFNTTEILSLESKGENKLVKGQIIGEVKGNSLQVIYTLEIDNNWNVNSVSISTETDTAFSIFLERKSNKWYDKKKKHYKELDNVIDIDISLTPFTNTLPINRLKLPEGGVRDITVLYFNLPKNEFRPVKQRYTNLGKNKYRYENLETNYISIIQTDADGFVIDYPGIWQMVYPFNNLNYLRKKFTGALLSDEPSAELSDADTLYNWLVGCWDISAVDYLPDGTKLTSEGECIFSWVMEGRAIQDLWIVPKRSLRSANISKTGNRYGTTLRIYNPQLKKWKIYWINPISGVQNELTAIRVGDEIIQTGVDSDGNPMRWIFSDIKNDSFHWRGEASTDGGKNWQLSTEFFGKRKNK